MSSHSCPKTPNIQAQFDLLNQVKKSDFLRLKKQLVSHKRAFEQLSNHGEPVAEKDLVKFAQLAQQMSRTTQYMEQSIEEKQQKLKNLPRIIYPDGLPIAENAEQIAKAIKDRSPWR